MRGQQGLTHRGPRRKVLVRARMRANGPPCDVCIRDISLRGMLLQTGDPPERGTYVEIISTGLPIVGQVVWMKDRRFGVSTRDTIDMAAVVNDFSTSGMYDTPTARVATRDMYRPAPDVAARLANSRSSGSAMQFGFVVTLCACAAFATAYALHDRLSASMTNVINHL